jgi:hypothetical protein
MLGILRRRAPRYLTLVWVAGLFVLSNTLTRLGLLAFEGDLSNVMPWRMLPIMAVGLLHDLAALSYLLIPFALAALLLPDHRWGRKAHAFLGSALVAAAGFALLLTAVAEAFLE